MIAKKVYETLGGILKPKNKYEIFKTLFKDTKFEEVDPDTIVYVPVHTILSIMGEKILETKGINFIRVREDFYIIWAPLWKMVEYYYSIGWKLGNLIFNLNKNAELEGTKEAEPFEIMIKHES